MLRQGKLEATVPVTVTEGDILSLRFDPAELVVPADDTVQPKVIATVKVETGNSRCRNRPRPPHLGEAAVTAFRRVLSEIDAAGRHLAYNARRASKC